jgi:hypothetical protein
MSAYGEADGQFHKCTEGDPLRVHARDKLLDIRGVALRVAEGLELLDRLINWGLVTPEQESILYNLFTRMDPK